MEEEKNTQGDSSTNPKIQKRPSFYTVNLANRLVDIILKWQDKQTTTTGNDSSSSMFDWHEISNELNSVLKETRSNSLLPTNFEGDITPSLCHKLWKFIAYNQIISDEVEDYSSDIEEFSVQPMTSIRKYKYSNTNSNNNGNSELPQQQQQQQQEEEVVEVDEAKNNAIQSSKDVWTAARHSVILEVSPGLFNGLPYLPLVATQAKSSRMPFHVRVTSTTMGAIRMFGKPQQPKRAKVNNTTGVNDKKALKVKGVAKKGGARGRRKDQQGIDGGTAEREVISIKALKKEFQDKKKAAAAASSSSSSSSSSSNS